MQLDAAVREAFDVAYDNIYAFHLAQKGAEKSVENMKVSHSSAWLLVLPYFLQTWSLIYNKYFRVLDANGWQGAFLL